MPAVTKKMNLDRLQTLITVMKRVRDNNYAFNMSAWQEILSYVGCAKTNEKTLHRCGMPACVGGWLAVSPEFIADGGSACVEDSGAPVFDGRTGGGAIAAYLECTYSIARAICWAGGPRHSADFYGVANHSEVTPAHVVKALERLYAQYAGTTTEMPEK